MGDFRMPSLGADMDEGTLLEWLVRPGDTVHRGDIVAVVDTAKSAVEVECFADGIVEALVVDPGQVDAELVCAPPDERRAHELGIDLATVRGSGEGGVVTRHD